MCGRFVVPSTTDELLSVFDATGDNAAAWQPSYSVAPTDPAPIVREWIHDETVQRDLDLASWGLKPGWAKPGGPAPINARLESVASNGMFRSAFASQRCLVPMAGYYEWQQMDDGKQPYFIHSDGDVLAAAGLYAARQEGNAWKITFTIITRAARDASGEIHDRMPVFLTPDVWDQWLHPEKITDKEEVLSMLDRSSIAIAKTVTAYPVARTVNNVRTLDSEDRRLIEPIST
ncbi:SOS response-associated peptidase [Cryobacterium sp. TMT4-10]|uniref:SOS response-associated peptidase n=1 Tax=Cryobacterium sp. TMT4-10 TaxID=1259256 RepID=UPI00106D372A|nr:SOS response-associated peptidase [Cryobacterium sp. TMT4-10]TFD17860.1 SOS response-associated peptidase [Cryobacterium sp. TMT4-10]